MGKQTGETFKGRDSDADHKGRRHAEGMAVIQSAITKSRLTWRLLAASPALGVAVTGPTVDTLPANLTELPHHQPEGEGCGASLFRLALTVLLREAAPGDWCDEGLGDCGTGCISVPTKYF